MRKIARAIIIHEGKILVIKRNKYGDKFFVIPGGGIDEGELAEEAAVREVLEEASIESKVIRKVYQEEVTEFGSTTYFLSEYISGKPKLHVDSEEAAETAKGENTFEPMWLRVEDMPKTRLLPTKIHEQLVHDLENAFPEEVVTIKAAMEKL